ncbi:MAG: ImmA/IrrE family metallo-endopeptidase [Pseudanabaena sp.]
MTQSIAKPKQVDLSTLYDRLRKLGFNQDFIFSNGLPDWWCEEYEASGDAVLTAAAYLSRRFNLDLPSLLNPDLNPIFDAESKALFKTVKNQDANDENVKAELAVAQNLALRVAELIAYTYKCQYQSIVGMTAKEIRAAILDKYTSVTLEALLGFCHEYGIPIGHFAEFPTKVKKFFGMVTQSKGHPVIVVSLCDLSPSRLSFIIAHELGHIALGHLEDGLIISEQNLGMLDQLDDDESAANEFAAELILGQPDRVYYFPHYMTAEALSESAMEKSRRDRVDAGSIAWNYGWYKTSHFPVARKAAGLIEKNSNAPQQINRYLSKSLDWDSLSNDNREFLALALGLDIVEIIEESWNCLPVS